VVPLVKAQLMVRGLLPSAMVAIGPVALTTPLIGKPVALVKVPEAGVPKTGVTKVGEVQEFPPTQNVPEAASGRVSVAATVPEAGEMVITPVLPLLAKAKVPVRELATPKVGVALKAGLAPARTSPATPVIEIKPAALIATGAVAVSAPPPDEVTHVPHAIVPLVVNVPPVIGAVVATDVTVPVPAAFPVCPCICQFVPSYSIKVSCPTRKSLATIAVPPPCFFTGAAELLLTFKVMAPVLATSA
jgi:hypothetical protein